MKADEDLFGALLGGVDRGGKAKIRRSGYASIPGTGPAGESCGTCRHMATNSKWCKCELMRPRWTRGYGTDVLKKSPACSRWEAKP